MNKTQINMKISYGANRTVFIFEGHFVIKIPRLKSWTQFLHGLLGNLQERLFSVAKWVELCPVIWADPIGLCLIMKYAKPLTDKEWEGFDYAAFRNKEFYVVPVEGKQDSFGIIDGNIVAVDYGS